MGCILIHSMPCIQDLAYSATTDDCSRTTRHSDVDVYEYVQTSSAHTPNIITRTAYRESTDRTGERQESSEKLMTKLETAQAQPSIDLVGWQFSEIVTLFSRPIHWSWGYQMFSVIISQEGQHNAQTVLLTRGQVITSPTSLVEKRERILCARGYRPT